MHRVLLVAAGLAMLGACDDTVFKMVGEGGGDAELYAADWEGVSDFVEARCVSCHPGVGPGDFPEAFEEDVRDGNEVYVVPGDPDASLLWRVLSSNGDPGSATPMPFGIGPLPYAQVQHIRLWILDGAELP